LKENARKRDDSSGGKGVSRSVKRRKDVGKGKWELETTAQKNGRAKEGGKKKKTKIAKENQGATSPMWLGTGKNGGRGVKDRSDNAKETPRKRGNLTAKKGS